MFFITLRRLTFLVLGLLFLQGFIYSQSTAGFRDNINRYSGILDYRFDRADREMTPQKWIEEARRGLESVRIIWEEMLPEVFRNSAMKESLSGEYVEWSEAALEQRFSQWLIKRFFDGAAGTGAAAAALERERADKLFLYKLDEKGNVLFDTTGDPLVIRPSDENHNYEEDLFLWRRQIEVPFEKKISDLQLSFAELYPELLFHVEETRRDEFGERLTELFTTSARSLKNEFHALVAREERIFTARRLGDAYSLRKKSEGESGSAVGINLIEETRRITNEGLSILEAKIEAAEAGVHDLALAGNEWLAQYREQFERGLNAWEKAEERFFVRRVEWEQSALSSYHEGEDAWDNAFAQFDEARREWEYKAKDLFSSGEQLFKNAAGILEKSIAEAKAEFARDSRLRTESASEKAKAWADMYITASSVASEAAANIAFWEDRYAKRQDGNINNTLTISEEIEHWKSIHDSYSAKAGEAKSFLENEFSLVMGTNGLKDVLSPDFSSEDFFLDEYQVELLRAKAVAGYWNRQVDIAMRVLTYAEDLTAGRITESEGIKDWESAKANYDDAVFNYESRMDLLETANGLSHGAREKMKEALETLEKSEADLEKLNALYRDLISAFQIQKEKFFLDEIDFRDAELGKLALILDDTNPDSLMMRYIKAAYESGNQEDIEYETGVIRELISGGVYYEKSTAELSRIVSRIIVLDNTDMLPVHIEEYGISKENPYYSFLELLLEQRESALLEASNGDDKRNIAENYQYVISALCNNVKNTVERELQNRVIALESLIVPTLEFNTEDNLRQEWEDAYRNLLRTKIELEYEALQFLQYGKPVKKDAEVLAAFCALDIRNIPAAERALEYMDAILSQPQNENLDTVKEELKRAALENEFIKYFAEQGGFFSGFDSLSYTDLFLDGYFAEIERIEGMIMARQLVNTINPAAVKFTEDENLLRLSAVYDSLDIEYESILPVNINQFIDAMRSGSSDPLQEAGNFLLLLDRLCEHFPTWMRREVNTWKEEFIEAYAYTALDLIESGRETELLAAVRSAENECSVPAEGNYGLPVIGNAVVLETERKLRFLRYQLAMVQKAENLRTASRDEGLTINMLRRKTELVNLAFDTYKVRDKNYPEFLIDTIKRYIARPDLPWDEEFESGEFKSGETVSVSLGEALYEYMYREQNLRREISQLEKNLRLLNAGDGTLEKEIETISSKIAELKKEVENNTLEYFRMVDNFSTTLADYDMKYSESKMAYSYMEEMRHEYETQDAVRRWADTAYLDITAPKRDLNISLEKSGLAEEALSVLNDLYLPAESMRPYEGAEYQEQYREYADSYSDVALTLKAYGMIGQSIEEEVRNNSALREIYKNQLRLLDGGFTPDFNSESEKKPFFKTITELITVSNGNLVFLRDKNFHLRERTAEETGILEEFFSLVSDPEDGSIGDSEYDKALLDLNRRLGMYNFSFDKYNRWGLARDYLLLKIGEGLSAEKKQKLGINKISTDVYKWFNRSTWDQMSQEEQADIEFYTIISLASRNNQDYLSRIPELIDATSSYRDVQEEFDEKNYWANIFLIGIFFKGAAEEAQYRLGKARNLYDHLYAGVNKSLNSFTENQKKLSEQYKAYMESTRKIGLLYGKPDAAKKIDWPDLEEVVAVVGIEDRDMERLKLLWREVSLTHDLSSLDIPETMRFIMITKEDELKAKRVQFDQIWQKDSEDRVDKELIYRNQYEQFLLGNINAAQLALAAEEAFGRQSASLKTHLFHNERLLRDSVELFSGDDPGIAQYRNKLVIGFAELIGSAHALRYNAELAFREVEWEAQYRDLEVKYNSWKDTSSIILESGREDWKRNSDALRDARDRWTRQFEAEYQRTDEAWNAAYLAGLADKEEWVLRATAAAHSASSEAVLAMVGSDAEVMARTMDTRDPIGFLNDNGVTEAKKTLDGLLRDTGFDTLEKIFYSADAIARTVNTTVNTGLRTENTSSYDLALKEAFKLARTARDELDTREMVKLAANLNDMAEKALEALMKNVDRANADFRGQMNETFIVEGQWRRSGLDYSKKVLVHSTLVNSMITENVFVKGFVDYIPQPININADLSEGRIRNMNSAAIEDVMKSFLVEISAASEKIFGIPDGDGSFAQGEFGKYLGDTPEIKSSVNIDDGKPGAFNHYGDGEIGRLLTEYYFWYFKEQKGLALMNAAPWEKPMWDSRGGLFEAPTLKGIASLALRTACTVTGVIAAPISGGASILGTIAINTALNSAVDLVFATADVIGGYKTWEEAGVEFGKSLLMNAISSAGNALTGNLADTFSNIVGPGAAAQITATLGSSMLTGVKDMCVGTINSAIGAISYDNSSGWGWSYADFNEGVNSGLKNALVSTVGSMTSGFLNVSLDGFTQSYLSNGKKLHNLLGGFAGQGVNYALGDDFTLNLFNLGIFNDDASNLGLLELSMDRKGITMGLGSGGVDISYGMLKGAVLGLETWKVNTEIFTSNFESAKKYQSQLRTLYSGDEYNRFEYENVLAGRTVYKELNNVLETESIYYGLAGVKTVYLGSDAVNNGSRFGLNVILSHESYRDGIVRSETEQKYETAQAVIGHSLTALELSKSYGSASIDAQMAVEAQKLYAAMISGDIQTINTIINAYDSSGDYYKLIQNDGIWELVDDGNPDFDISDLLQTYDITKRHDTAKSTLMTAVVLSQYYDDKTKGVISAERMTFDVASALGDSVIPQPTQNGFYTGQLYDYADLDARSRLVRNELIRKSMTGRLFSLNITPDSDRSERMPYLLGTDSEGNNKYLVPMGLGPDHVRYFVMDQTGFYSVLNRELVEHGKRQVDKNYIYGAKDPVLENGLDCSGFSRWAIMQVYGRDLPILNANGQATHPDLTVPGDEGYGTLIYHWDATKNPVVYDHVSMNLGNGTEINPYGGPANHKDNPAKIIIRDIKPERNHNIISRQINWHYLFFRHQ